MNSPLRKFDIQTQYLTMYKKEQKNEISTYRVIPIEKYIVSAQYRWLKKVAYETKLFCLVGHFLDLTMLCKLRLKNLSKGPKGIVLA